MSPTSSARGDRIRQISLDRPPLPPRGALLDPFGGVAVNRIRTETVIG
jgi:hypothetical protein